MSSAQDILIVEDEPKLAALLAEYLQAAGFTARVLGDGNAVVPEVRSRPPALLLLDLMLPGRDGLAICRELRGFTQLPIIMVTARVEEIDRLLGLELGADDYICKPFSPREVVARVKAVLRRQGGGGAVQGGPVAGLNIEPQAWRAELDGHKLDLTPVEFRLLETLAAHPGRVFSRAALLERIYADHRVVSDRTVDSHVKNLRRKLGEAAPERELLHSVYGVGYRLEE
ncbi:response regulator [Thioalkalivibrio sp. XN279]|uniref:response regulator n=1 Tax=Thioalkalivibrio sp. XN279 TaxID=2714953 RepID=UPI00140A0F9A|nr:response regulator [Thioalkalivibrio sp. XN279]